jgi:phosphotransferase system enzyme I (PtsI)
MHRLTGIGVSPGAVWGRAVILIQRTQALRHYLSAARIDAELARLEASRRRSREQLIGIRAQVARSRSPELAPLFDAQLLMLDDPMILPRAIEIVRMQHVNAEWALQQVFHEIGSVFDDVADPYLRERKGDVADLVGRLRMNLRHGLATPRELLGHVDESSVLIADELTPSFAAQVDWTKVRGFATDAGSRTYHTAILARSLDVPAVVGLHDASRIVQAGQIVIIDADAHELIVDPDESALARVVQRTEDRRPAAARERRPAGTSDGVRVRLEANIEFPDDLTGARYVGAEGIGLYRSEFLLTTAGDDMASEDAQYAVYRRMLEEMAPNAVTVRTFDVDEEQLARRAIRPSLVEDSGTANDRSNREGLRGLRLSLRRPEIFEPQLRALLRAARHGTLRIMFPFVSSVEQVREARRILSTAISDLRQHGEAVPDVPVGVMIEIPAAAYTADLLAHEVDFFTIGTNDLIQYCLAVDRADERVSRLYEPLHPAILRVIMMVRRAAARRRIPVSLCGEMASDPAVLALLVGLGLREFSMTPGAINLARQVLAELRSDDLRALVRRLLRLRTSDEIEQELTSSLERFQLHK